MAVPVLDDYTYQYGDDGPLMGGGLVYDVLKVEGLGMPEIRLTQQDRDGADGEFVFAQFTRGRTLAISGMLKIPTGANPEQYLDEYLEAFSPRADDAPFYYKTPGVDQRVIYCRPTAAPVDYDENLNTGYIPFLVQLIAEDPRKYSAGQLSFGPVGLPSTSGGRSFPKVYPKAYGTIATGGTILVTNAGNATSYPVFTITGTVSNPIVSNDTNNTQMQLNVDLSTSDQLVIDTGINSVTLNGTERADLLIGTEVVYLSGGTNSIRFSANSFTSTGTLRGTYRHAWR